MKDHWYISPEIFVETLEGMGLAYQLNLYVVKQVIKHFDGIKTSNKLNLSLNLSPAIHDIEKHFGEVVNLIKGSKLLNNIHLDIEITETSFMTSEVNFAKDSPIDKLLMGNKIGLALDDFGIKYSSINRLFECNFSCIKIDMSFVKKLDTADGGSAKTVIEAIMHIAKGLNIKVVAEGAETKQQVEILKQLGCQTAQGYYYFKPLSIEKFKKIINAKSD